MSPASSLAESWTRCSHVCCLIICCLEKNLSISYTSLFKLSVGTHSNASSAQVPNQAGPEIIWEQQLYLLDAEVQKQTQGRILYGQMSTNSLSSVFVCMYDEF